MENLGYRLHISCCSHTCSSLSTVKHLGKTKGSKAAVEEAVYAISWAHSMAGMPSPTADQFVQIVLAGLKRYLAKLIIKKEPFTVDIVKVVVEDAKKDGSLASIWLVTMCAMAFAGFLRYSEVSNIRLCDLTLNPDHLKIRIPKSKSDQLREGDEVVIARSASRYFLVGVLHGEGGNNPWEQKNTYFEELPVKRSKP